MWYDVDLMDVLKICKNVIIKKENAKGGAGNTQNAQLPRNGVKRDLTGGEFKAKGPGWTNPL